MYLEAYSKLTSIAIRTDRSEMDPRTHRDFMTIIDRAQKIVNLEAQQAGFPDLQTLPTFTGEPANVYARHEHRSA